MCRSEEDQNPILGPGKVVTQYVDGGNDAAEHTYKNPPHNPPVDAQLNMERLHTLTVAPWPETVSDHFELLVERSLEVPITVHRPGPWYVSQHSKCFRPVLQRNLSC
jgi:hypothetical protein